MPPTHPLQSGFLPPTLCYAVRRWTWLRHSDPTALADGQLTITQRRTLTPGTTSVVERYDVAQQLAPIPGWQVFFCVNLTSGEVYEVTLGDRGDLCTCRAGLFKVASGCKHRHALRAVIQAGGFDRDTPASLSLTAVMTVETAPAPLSPIVECVICGELMTGTETDGEAHAACEARLK